MKTTFRIFALAIIMCSCSSEDTKRHIPEPEVEFKELSKSAEIVQANNEFAFDFFKEIAGNAEEKNYMVSPVSLSLALSMAYNGATKDTKTAFENTLKYNQASLEEVNTVNQALIQNLASQKSGSIFEIANSLWIRDGFAVKQDFIKRLEDYYYATSDVLNFNDPNAVDIINDWVSDKTHGKIDEIIKSIPSDAMLYLINALYFNAKWKYEFETKDSKEDDFNLLSGEKKKVTFMNMESTLDYFENDLFSSVILPYKEDKFNMVILMPQEGKEIKDIVEEMNQENWNNWQSNYSSHNIHISMPKFKFSYKELLNESLQTMGMGIAFSDAANFNNISNGSLKISKVLQKTYIDVNEKGTEAAAATIVEIGLTSAGPPPSFIANKPFIFAITEKETNSICFIGKLGDPTY
jgi:serpin B